MAVAATFVAREPRDAAREARVEPSAPSAVQQPTQDADAFDFTGRGVYRYSVIPGGAYTVTELNGAIDRDVVVAAHYAQLDRSRLRTETVSRDRYVHVSYRKGNDVFWTKNKVLVRRGETILTDGTTQIRARCGNCISEQAMAPTSPEEPEDVEFDRLTDAPPEQAWGDDSALVPFASPPGESPLPSVGAAGSNGGGASPLAGGPSGGGAAMPLAGGTVSTRESGSPMKLEEPFVPGASFPPIDDGAWPPNSDFPLPGPDGPGGPTQHLFSADTPLPPDGSTTDIPPPGSPGEPAHPVPVPEPGSILLVGGGVAALLRIIRSRAA